MTLAGNERRLEGHLGEGPVAAVQRRIAQVVDVGRAWRLGAAARPRRTAAVAAAYPTSEKSVNQSVTVFSGQR